MKKILYLILLVSIASSCSLKTHYLQTGSQTYAKTDENNIQIFSKAPAREYKIIGNVAVFGATNGVALKALKKEAASIGADAVIEVTLDKINSFNAAIGISGIAVKYR